MLIRHYRTLHRPAPPHKWHERTGNELGDVAVYVASIVVLTLIAMGVLL